MKSWIKCVIFDLDGVLVNTDEMHFLAFKLALKKCANFDLTREWYARFSGITSKQKLKLLSKEENLPEDVHDDVMELKRLMTLDFISQQIRPDESKYHLFKTLKNYHDVKVCVASNSRLEFVELILKQLRIREFIDVVKGGDSVKLTKPNPQMYLTCMAELGTCPADTIIFEDAPAGKKAALDSGAHLVQVKHVSEVNLPFVVREIRNSEKNNRFNQFDAVILHGLKNVNVVVPMAGFGSRFAKAGFDVPKPFINVRGKSMVGVTIDSIGIPGRYIYCVQREHTVKYEQNMAELINYRDHIVYVDGVTEGAACTVLLAEQHIDNDEPLFIINSDQYIEWDWSRFMIESAAEGADAGIVVFEAEGTKWSYAKTRPGTNQVVEVAEKNPISTHATAGIYYWRRGSDFVKFAKQMIAKNIRVNNEFYVCPVYNEAIAAGLKIITFPCERMLGMGTPEDLLENLPKL